MPLSSKFTLQILVHLILLQFSSSRQFKRLITEEKVIQHLFSAPQMDFSTFPFCIHDELLAAGAMNETDEVETELNLSRIAFEDLLFSLNTSALKVDIQFSLVKLIAISERDQNIAMEIRTEVTWVDCRLAWSPKDFNMITEIAIPPERFRSIGMFVPLLYLREESNQAASQMSEVSVHLHHNGKMTVIREYSTVVSCDLDIEMYPFDHHACNFTFETQYNSINVNLTYEKADSVEEESWHLLAHGRFLRNKLWEMVVLPPTKDRRAICSKFDESSRKSLQCLIDRQVFRIVLARHPTYQVINLFTPAFLCVLVSASVYIIPNGASDKTFLMLCILLSTFWFAISIYERLPDTGDSLSWMSIYYFLCTSVVSLNCIVCAISATIGFSKVRVPRKVAEIVMRCAPILLRDMIDPQMLKRKAIVSSNNGNRGNYRSDVTEYDGQLENQIVSRRPTGSEKIESLDSRIIEITWLHVSACFDRIYFVSLMLFATGTLLLFVLAGYYQPKSYYAKHIGKEDIPYVNYQLERLGDTDILKRIATYI